MTEKHAIHESNALLMSAEDVFEDAARIAIMLDLQNVDPKESAQTFPQSAFNFSRDEIVAAIREIWERA